jgi:hypothetical protein
MVDHHIANASAFRLSDAIGHDTDEWSADAFPWRPNGKP